jgi:hypothetical protein
VDPAKWVQKADRLRAGCNTLQGWSNACPVFRADVTCQHKTLHATAVSPQQTPPCLMLRHYPHTHACGSHAAVLSACITQASQCFVLDLDQRAFLAAVKDRKAAGLRPVPATPQQDPATDTTTRGLPSGDIVVDPATYFGSSTSSGFSNTSWPVGQHVLDFFWGELTLSEGAPFECLTPDGKSTVSVWG